MAVVVGGAKRHIGFAFHMGVPPDGGILSYGRVRGKDDWGSERGCISQYLYLIMLEFLNNEISDSCV